MFQVHGKIIEPSSRSAKLSNLFPGTRYLVCVLALGNWSSRRKEIAEPRLTQRVDNASGRIETFDESIMPLLVNSPTSKCEEISTLGSADIMPVGSVSDHGYGVQSILTRRLGLIIGCCMGFVVFVVLVSVLGYLKMKKQRAAVKRDPPMPPEYISYRHFSIQSGETGAHGTHPNFITNMNTTSLNH